MRTVTVAAGSALVLCLGLIATPLTAQPNSMSRSGANTLPGNTSTTSTERRAPTGQQTAIPRGPRTPGGPASLSAQDCRNLGGTVVTVTDDRCGNIQQYCRMPDTNAACITDRT